MPKTFLSYARADAEFALKLANQLKTNGADLWIDCLDIPAGVRWDRAVQKSLNDCECLLLLLSPRSVDSDNVLDEARFGLENRKRVIPVRLADCVIPFWLSRLEYIDFPQSDEAIAKLVATLGDAGRGRLEAGDLGNAQGGNQKEREAVQAAPTASAQRTAAPLPELILDWPDSKLSDSELDAFASEVAFRADRKLIPLFRLSHPALQTLREKVSLIDKKENLSSEDRVARIESLEQIEYLERIENALKICVELAFSPDLQVKTGWLVPRTGMRLILSELLREPRTAGRIRALLINHEAHMQSYLYLEPQEVDKIFGLEWNHDYDFLSFPDYPRSEEIDQLSPDLQYRAFGAMLRKIGVQQNTSPLSQAFRKQNWIVSSD